jgi:hypothetical protein
MLRNRIRAYRMKFDEWGLRKNKSSKERRVRKTVSRASTVHRDNSSDEPERGDLASNVAAETSFQSETRTRLSNVDSMELTHLSSTAPPQKLTHMSSNVYPDNPPQSSEALSLADEDHAFDKLKTILHNWRSGASLEPVLLFLKLNWSSMHPKQVEKLFLVVETPGFLLHSPPKEKSLLVKTCLETDLKTQKQRDISYYNHSWLLGWWEACHTLDWDEAKAFLYKMQVTSLVLYGTDQDSQLLDCALIVTAERLLGYLKERLEVRRARIEPLSAPHESEEARNFRDAYITILDDCRVKELDVGISWYKYALQVAAWNEAVATVIQDQQKQRLEQLEKDGQKYRQLKSRFKSMEAGVSNSGDVVA